MATIATPESEAPPGNQSPAGLESAASLPSVYVPEAGRSLALAILATIAVVFALDWAQSFVISLLLGILFAYPLNPLVVWLNRISIPRVVGAGIVMVVVLDILAYLGEATASLRLMPGRTSTTHRPSRHRTTNSISASPGSCQSKTSRRCSSWGIVPGATSPANCQRSCDHRQ